jgi:putative PIN family toxin of toxin-antitoxin system
MKVFVDANTIVSGLLFVDNEATLLELGRLGALRLVTNEYVLKEIREVLKKEKFRLTEEERQHLMKYTLECILVVENPSNEEIKKHYDLLVDKKDLPVVVGAKKENCECLVTGDKELLSKRVKEFVNSTTTSELLGKLIKEKFMRL